METWSKEAQKYKKVKNKYIYTKSENWFTFFSENLQSLYMWSWDMCQIAFAYGSLWVASLTVNPTQGMWLWWANWLSTQMARTAGNVSAGKVAKALSVHLDFPQKKAKFGSLHRFLSSMSSQDLGRC